MQGFNSENGIGSTNIFLNVSYTVDATQPIVTFAETIRNVGTNVTDYHGISGQNYIGAYLQNQYKYIWYNNGTALKQFSNTNTSIATSIPENVVYISALNSADYGIGIFNWGRPGAEIINATDDVAAGPLEEYSTHAMDIFMVPIEAIPANSTLNNTVFSLFIGNKTEMNDYFTAFEYGIDFNAITPINQTIYNDLSDITVRVDSTGFAPIATSDLHWTNATGTYIIPMTIYEGGIYASINMPVSNYNYTYFVATVSDASAEANTSTVWTNFVDTVSPASITNNATSTGNFYVNNTWVNPLDADFNHTWWRYPNGTQSGSNLSNTTTFLNITYSPHYVQNLSVQTVDTSGNVNSTLVWFNATIPNNVPIQAPIGNQTAIEGDIISFTVNATDADNDTITYGTNASKGTLNTTTGAYSWTTIVGDAGVYPWYFNSSDGYGGIASETITVTVNAFVPNTTSNKTIRNETWFYSNTIESLILNATVATGPGWINVTNQSSCDNFRISLNGKQGIYHSLSNDTISSGWSYTCSGTVLNFTYPGTHYAVHQDDFITIDTNPLSGSIGTGIWYQGSGDNHNVVKYVFNNTSMSWYLAQLEAPTASEMNYLKSAGIYIIGEVQPRKATSPRYNWTDWRYNSTRYTDAMNRMTGQINAVGIANLSAISISEEEPSRAYAYARLHGDAGYPTDVDNYINVSNRFYVDLKALYPNTPICAGAWISEVNWSTGGSAKIPTISADCWVDDWYTSASVNSYGHNNYLDPSYNNVSNWFDILKLRQDNGTPVYSIIWGGTTCDVADCGSNYYLEGQNYSLVVTDLAVSKGIEHMGWYPLDYTISTPHPTVIFEQTYNTTYDYWNRSYLYKEGEFLLMAKYSSPAINPTIEFDNYTVANLSTITVNYTTVNLTTSTVSGNASVFLNLNNDLRLFFRFNESSGTTKIDESGFNNNGTASGDVSIGNSGRFGKELFFNNSTLTGIVTVPKSDSINLSGSYTMEADLYPIVWGGGSYGRIVDKSSGSTGYAWFVANETVGAAPLVAGMRVLHAGTTYDSDNNSILLQQRQVVAVVFNSSNQSITFYRNGVKKGTRTTVSVNPNASSVNLTVGNNIALTRGFGGYISNLRVSNRAKSWDEINASYNSTLYPYSANLTNLSDGTYNMTGYFQYEDGMVQTELRNFTVDTTSPASITGSATTTGNFWINNTWTNPGDADFNHTWWKYANGTQYGSNLSNTTTSLNITYSPHYTQNLSAQTVDIAGNVNSTLVWFNVTIPNNVPIQAPIGNQTVTEGDTISFTVSATDLDSDTITYGTNASKGTFNTTTGAYSWVTVIGDAGVYSWYFNSSDAYSGVATETITVTVNAFTGGNTTPALSSVQNQTCLAHSCVISFNVNQSNAITWTRYGLNTSLLQNTTNQSSGTNRTDNITGLTNNTLYYYSVYAVNSSNTSLSTNSTIQNFTTAEDFVPPSPNPPAINYNLNNITSDSSTTITVNTYNSVLFSAGANQTITTWTWGGSATKIGGDGTTNSTASRYFSTIGDTTVTVQGTNPNGSTSVLTWTIHVVASGGGGTQWWSLSGTITPSGSTLVTNPSVCSTTGGAYSCDFLFEDGQTYWINISKAGYYSNNTQILFDSDKTWSPTLSAIPTNITIITDAATGIRSDGATLNGEIFIAPGTSSQMWFEYGTNGNTYPFKTPTQSTSVNTSFSYSLRGAHIIPNTKYYYRAVAYYNSVYYYGD